MKVIQKVFKTVNDDAMAEEQVKRITRRFGLSEFEMLIEFCTWNANNYSLKKKKTLNMLLKKNFKLWTRIFQYEFVDKRLETR